jgi:salicylate hydroxylase
MAQGAAQAIEDAATLATCVAQQPADTAAALRRYERLRIPRTSRLQAMSAQNKLRFHLPDGPARQDRDGPMATGTTDSSSRAVSWIYRHDAHAIDASTPHVLARRGKRRWRTRHACRFPGSSQRSLKNP